MVCLAQHGPSQVPSPYQITDLSKEVFTLKEALKAQQSTPASSKEEEEALRGQVTALQQQIQVLALYHGAGVIGATVRAIGVEVGMADRVQAGLGTSDTSLSQPPAATGRGVLTHVQTVWVCLPVNGLPLLIPSKSFSFLPSPSCSLPPFPFRHVAQADLNFTMYTRMSLYL